MNATNQITIKRPQTLTARNGLQSSSMIQELKQKAVAAAQCGQMNIFNNIMHQIETLKGVN